MDKPVDDDTDIDLDTEIKGQYAAFAVRLVAFMIDAIIILAFSVILTLVITYPAINDYNSGGYAKSVAAFSKISSALLIILFLSSLVYETFFLSSRYMATPGKMLSGIKVTKPDGKRVSIIGSFIRFIFKIGLVELFWIPIVNIFSAICIVSPTVIMLTDKKRALHDLYAGTIVTCT